jgi:hypothetical protein
VELFEEIRRGYAAGDTIQGLAVMALGATRRVRSALTVYRPIVRFYTERDLGCYGRGTSRV